MRSASDPGFWITYAVLQGVVLLALVRALDRYSRHPLAVLIVMVVWGGTGAASLSLLGNGVVHGLLSDTLAPFSDAISPPLVEEAAKGIAIVALVGPGRWLARQLGVPIFDGVSSGIIYGVAVGVGFAFTEDAVYLLRGASNRGAAFGLETFVYRRDALTVLHHSMYAAAFGAAVGLAVWTHRRWLRWALPIAGFAVAAAMHAANNGLVDVLVIRRHGREAAASWRIVGGGPPDVEATISSGLRTVEVLDYAYVVLFLIALALWLRYQRRVVRDELTEEVHSGLVDVEEVNAALSLRPAWDAGRRGAQWRLRGRARHELIDLGMLKWRHRHFGGDWEGVAAARRRVAASALEHPQVGGFHLPPDPLVGRESELAAIDEVLRTAGTAIVTLTGPGGTGKTRLAMELAARLAPRFASGVALVALEAASEPDEVVAAIAQTLDVRPIGDQTLLGAVAEYLKDRHLLLVLDNFEQAASSSSAIVVELARSAARVKLLVTSRVALRVSGEHEVPLDVLPLDDAVELLVERARSRAAEINVDAPGERALVEALCTRLDRLPLALELGAAQLRLFGAGELLERLERRFELPMSGARDLPARQQTLRRTVDWSHDLLGPPDRVVFAAMSVFVGGWTLAAAESVLDGQNDVAASIGVLAEANLVRREEGADGVSRYRMLETIRAYTRDRLEESEASDVRRALHAKYFVALAGRARAGLAGPEQLAWIRRLRPEHENLRAAIDWLFAAQGRAAAVGMVVDLAAYWEEHGELSQPRRWLESAVNTNDSLPRRSEALLALGRMTLLQGDYAAAASLLEASGGVADDVGATTVAIAVRYERAFLALVAGRYEEAAELAGAGLVLAQDTEEHQLVARGHHVLGRAAAEGGDTTRARTELDQALALRRRLGDRRGMANSLSNLGRVALLDSERDEAIDLIQQGLEMARDLGDALRTAEALHFLGCTALVIGDPHRAAVVHAERLWLSRGLGEAIGIVESLEALGAAAQFDGDAEHAATLAGAASHLRTSLGIVMWPLEREYCDKAFGAARIALGDRFDTAWRRGRDMSVEQASSYAVET